MKADMVGAVRCRVHSAPSVTTPANMVNDFDIKLTVSHGVAMHPVGINLVKPSPIKLTNPFQITVKRLTG